MLMCTGMHLKLIRRCYASRESSRVVMLVFATNGYHSSASYKWTLSRNELPCGTTPLLYSSVLGVYTCDVTAEGQQLSVKFRVSGM